MTDLLAGARPAFVMLCQLSVVLSSTLCCAQGGFSDGWKNGVVAADHPAASEAGVEMLRIGGNAVDAAVATSFALSVLRPASCGIGGGGFMVIWDAKKQEAVALDYRERAPAAARADMFADVNGDSLPESASVRGGRAVAVPGTVAGLCFAAKEYGSLPLATLLQPAIRLALNPAPVDEHGASVANSTLEKLKKNRGYVDRFAELRRLYLNDGAVSHVGDKTQSPQWRVLYRIAKSGPAAFYEGEVARAIVDTVNRHGGIISMEDLRDAKPIVRKPINGQFHATTILSMPPASSGGIALLQTLQSLEQWEELHGRQLFDLGHNSARYVHVVSEAMKHAFADRAEFLGDSDFVDVPTERLLDVAYAAEIAGRIRSNETLPDHEYGRFFSSDDAGTSHFSVIDKDGNAVACTETINLTFGSFVVVPEFGIILNNEMDDFAARPGEPNAFGLIQSHANRVEPGKKPLSSMTPTIAVRNGRAVFSSGASGGPRIISSTIQAMLNHIIFRMKPSDAVSAPRFHHQWFPNRLYLESKLASSVGDQLKKFGHNVQPSGSLAANQSVSAEGGRLYGGSDPRKHGSPAGY